MSDTNTYVTELGALRGEVQRLIRVWSELGTEDQIDDAVAELRVFLAQQDERLNEGSE